MSNVLLDVKNINVYYGGIHALHDVSIHINEGEIVSIIGSNGAGKSTTMRTIVGEKKVSSGEITFNGSPLPKAECDVIKGGISLVPEGRRIFSALTVRENLIIGTYPRRKDKAGIADSAVSVVVPDAVVYLPLEDLVDFEQERERLAKEEVRLNKEIKRAQGMLSNEKFVSKAPAAKVQEERDKLEKYTQMLEQVKERIAGLGK